MTNESAVDMTDARQWALGTLAMDGRSDAVDSATLLRHVAQEGYVLSPQSIDAAIILMNGSNRTLFPAESLGRRKRLEMSVAHFASAFFDLEPEERERRWQQLSAACREIPSLTAWLEHMSRELRLLTPPAPTNELGRELIRACCDIRTTNLPDGIRRRQEFMAICRSQPRVWRPIAHDLMRRAPEFVDVVAPWVEEITQIPFENNEVRPISVPARPAVVSVKEDSKEQKFPYWVVGVVFVVFLRFMAINSPPNSPYAPAYSSVLRNSQGPQTAPGSLPVTARPKVHTFSYENLSRRTRNGLFADVPGLSAWIENPENRRLLESTLTGISPDVDDEISSYYLDREIRARYARASEIPLNGGKVQNLAEAPNWLMTIRLMVISSNEAASDSTPRVEEASSHQSEDGSSSP